ncbi:SdrD B-like domain-containing protein [Micromonospora sp. M12]
MTGNGWIDTNRDGQRDAGEPTAYGKIGKIEFVLEGTEPEWDVPRATVYEDGTYRTRLKPGRYVANVYLQDGSPYTFTTPNVGDDATDSDIIGSTGGYYNRGWSAVVEVSDAGQTLVDIGLVPAAQS